MSVHHFNPGSLMFWVSLVPWIAFALTASAAIYQTDMIRPWLFDYRSRLPGPGTTPPYNAAVVLMDDDFASRWPPALCGEQSPSLAAAGTCGFGYRAAALIRDLVARNAKVIALDFSPVPNLLDSASTSAFELLMKTIKEAASKGTRFVILEHVRYDQGKYYLEPALLRLELKSAGERKIAGVDTPDSVVENISFGYDLLDRDPGVIPWQEEFFLFDPISGTPDAGTTFVADSFALATARAYNSRSPWLFSTPRFTPMATFWRDEKYAHCRAVDLLENNAKSASCFPDGRRTFRDQIVFVGASWSDQRALMGLGSDNVQNLRVGTEFGVFLQASYTTSLLVLANLQNRLPKELVLVLEALMTAAGLILTRYMQSRFHWGSGFVSPLLVWFLASIIFLFVAGVLALFDFTFDAPIPVIVFLAHTVVEYLLGAVITWKWASFLLLGHGLATSPPTPKSPSPHSQTHPSTGSPGPHTGTSAAYGPTPTPTASSHADHESTPGSPPP